MMNIKHIRTYLMVCSLVVVFQPLQGLAQGNSDAAKASAQQAPAERDGQHDFDFEIGTWKIHLKRLDHRLTGSTTWVEFDGTSVTRKVWDGRADLEEFETDSPAGGHIEGLTLRLYDPQTHQWSLYWATSKSGAMGPPTIGEFRNGRGEFFDTEPSRLRTAWVQRAGIVRASHVQKPAEPLVVNVPGWTQLRALNDVHVEFSMRRQWRAT